ncbi:hypothetical protein [Jonesia quinghaiensis]|uniref:hypothetical protein n=1 Tax=Jonesia quinghaiensis TaxID=262806 RepID=UPI00048E23A3|nr:hypothetical protein [Jonesia quinghaiensis]
MAAIQMFSERYPQRTLCPQPVSVAFWKDDVDDDRVFDPMIYDAMREFATRISGQYVAWKREAKTTEEAEHWQREMLRFNAEVRAVDHRSKSAIEAKRAELRELWASLPVDAPKFAA